MPSEAKLIFGRKLKVLPDELSQGLVVEKNKKTKHVFIAKKTNEISYDFGLSPPVVQKKNVAKKC